MTTARFSLSSFAYEPSIEEQILANGYPLDPVESIYGGENLSLFESQLYAPTYMESSETHPDEVPKELIQKEVIPVENPVTQIINNDETINEEVLTGVNMEVLTGFTQPILSLTSQASGELSTDTNAASGSIIEDSQDLMTGTLTMDSAS